MIPNCKTLFKSPTVELNLRHVTMLRKKMPYLHILHGARLGHAQHVEQLQDQLLDVLQGILLRQEGWVDLLLHLNIKRERDE